jgi:hypothetical protein
MLPEFNESAALAAPAFLLKLVPFLGLFALLLRQQAASGPARSTQSQSEANSGASTGVRSKKGARGDLPKVP